MSKGSIFILPVIFFISVFLGTGLYFTYIGEQNAFYQLPAPLIAMMSIVLALFLDKRNFSDKFETVLKGMGEKNILIMVIIYLLSSGFSVLAAKVGASTSVVSLFFHHIPFDFILPGIFLMSSLISFSLGSGVGTIATVLPLLKGLSGIVNPVWLSATVVGGACFGDSLSFISDTTIAATKSLGCNLKDKFKENSLIAIPSAILTLLVLVLVKGEALDTQQVNSLLDLGLKSNYISLTPYFIVVLLSLIGIDVIFSLFIGAFLAGIIGFFCNHLDLLTIVKTYYSGLISQDILDVFFLSLFMGGLMEIVKEGGGFTFWIKRLENVAKGPKSAEASIAALVSLMDLSIANNTIAIIVSSSLVSKLAKQYDISKKRLASILDSFSCIFQYIIPYGAQILLASAIMGVSTIEISKFMIFPFIYLFMGILYICIKK